MTCSLLSNSRRQAYKDDFEHFWRTLLAPPDNKPVDVWAEENLSLSERESEANGRLRLDRSPYLREIVRCQQDPNVQTVSLCFGSQSGKTLALLIVLCFVLYEGGPCMVALSTQELADDVSTDRFDPLIESSESLKGIKGKGKHDWTIRKKRFERGILYFRGAQSQRRAKSTPTKLLICDEIDDFKGASKGQAGTLDQLKGRTKGWLGRKIYQSSTPTMEHGNIWKEFKSGTQKYYLVPCPHCSTEQKLVFEQIQWDQNAKRDGSWDIEQAKASAFYQCCNPKCEGRIEDKHKPEMLLQGRWVAEHPERKGQESYHLSSLYPVWISWGRIVEEFLKKKDHPDDVKNFRTNWLAEPWEARSKSLKKSELLSKCLAYEPSVSIPQVPVAVFLSTDVQEHGKEIWYVVRAWCHGETSYLLAYGKAPGIDEITRLAGLRYAGFPVNHVLIDSGAWGRNVESFCAKFGYIPTKGTDTLPRNARTTWGQTGELKLPLLHIATIPVKDALADKWAQTNGIPGSWYIPNETPVIPLGEYLHHLSSERLVIDTSKGWTVRRWEPFHTTNHLFDCEVIQLAAAIEYRIRNAPEPIDPKVPPPPKPKNEEDEQERHVPRFRKPDGSGFWDFVR